MKKMFRSVRVLFAFSMLTLLVVGGCSQEEAAEALKNAESNAEDAAKTVSEDAEKIMAKGEEVAGELAEQAAGFLAPIKEKVQSLDKLKETPAELKTAVVDLIDSIEAKSEEIKLPEPIANALAAVKDKMIALRDYLEGEADPAKIKQYVDEIKEMVGSKLGLSGN